jgi:hypothetical protein
MKLDTKHKQLPLDFKPKTSHIRAGTFHKKDAVKEALKKAISNSALDRESVARELSRLVGEEVSYHTVNNWIAEGKNNRRFPLEYTAALVVITGDMGIFESAMGPGMRLMSDSELPFYELGKMVAEEKKRRKRKKAIMDQIEGF